MDIYGTEAEPERQTYVHTTNKEKSPFTSLVWGSLQLAPIILVQYNIAGNFGEGLIW